MARRQVKMSTNRWIKIKQMMLKRKVPICKRKNILGVSTDFKDTRNAFTSQVFGTISFSSQKCYSYYSWVKNID